MTHSAQEAFVVGAQLGRASRGSWAVAATCHLGLPTVIENHPLLEDGAPFPTLFWLTCPLLVKRVSRLESEGAMKTLSARLGRDARLRSRLQRALAGYIERRSSHVPRGDVPFDDAAGAPGGGPARVKCLHAHAAHELAAAPNAIGALVLARTGFPECIHPCVQVQP